MAASHASLNVIGLVSGGKDSFFSLLHCIANNHNVIALANLYPPSSLHAQDELEDLNSFMYQTAGHETIPLFSEALDLPLYRQEITGTAKDMSKDYGSALDAVNDNPLKQITAKDDETESLLPLLRKVIAAHPAANAVCSGAILSSYQRTRIESVARRLNLIPLCYLWQYPSLPPPSPGGLLDDMAAAGLDVRIVKVASGGLDAVFLWNNLMTKTVRQRLDRAVSRFGGSVLGEGGEYETLVLDGPAYFWKGRLEIESRDRMVGTGSGGEAWVAFKKSAGTVVKKKQPNDITESTSQELRIPDLYDRSFNDLCDGLEWKDPEQSLQSTTENTQKSRNVWKPGLVTVHTPSTVTLSNVTATHAGITAGDQMLGINVTISDFLLQNQPMTISNVVFTTILLQSMGDFASVNSVYEQLFTRPNPPARVTVACGETLPLDVRVTVSFVMNRGSNREGLHVQSRSYWAPANIGPYSQAISVPLQIQEADPRLVYVAGQIPLIPASMAKLDGEENNSMLLFARQTCLALQHLWRIGTVMNVSWWTNAVAFVAGEADIEAKALLAWQAWRDIHERRFWIEEASEDEDENFDVWDRSHGGFGSLAKIELKSPSLPNFARAHSRSENSIPPFLAVRVLQLPRGCDIEWQSVGIAYQNDETATIQNVVAQVDIESHQCIWSQVNEILNSKGKLSGLDATVYTVRPDLVSDLDVQLIPCKAVWGRAGLKLVASIIIRNARDP